MLFCRVIISLLLIAVTASTTKADSNTTIDPDFLTFIDATLEKEAQKNKQDQNIERKMTSELGMESSATNGISMQVAKGVIIAGFLLMAFKLGVKTVFSGDTSIEAETRQGALVLCLLSAGVMLWIVFGFNNLKWFWEEVLFWFM